MRGPPEPLPVSCRKHRVQCVGAELGPGVGRAVFGAPSVHRHCRYITGTMQQRIRQAFGRIHDAAAGLPRPFPYPLAWLPMPQEEPARHPVLVHPRGASRSAALAHLPLERAEARLHEIPAAPSPERAVGCRTAVRPKLAGNPLPERASQASSEGAAFPQLRVVFPEAVASQSLPEGAPRSARNSAPANRSWPVG